MMDGYIASYMDRRMKLIIDEWQLATKHDLRDLNSRFKAIQHEIKTLKEFEHETDKKLTHLEHRAKKLKEQMK